MITPDKSSKKSKKIQVKDMFNNISSKYDRINQVMTLNMDKNWRQIVYNLSMQDNPKKIIDIATGTGDIALCFAKDDVEVIGIDNARQMLDIANQKKSSYKNIQFQLEDAENMSFANNSFDVATVGFGVRNFENLHQGLVEIKRILKPGKKLIIPFLGRIIAGNQKAYNYLSSSAEHFPHGKEFKTILENAGFENIDIKMLSMGIVNIYSASKPR